MKRILFIAGFGILAVALMGMLLSIVRSPIAEQETALNARLESMQPRPIAYRTTPGLAADKLVASITAKPALWKALVEAPPPPKQIPNLAQLLQGVTVTRDRMKTPDGAKVRIRTPKDPRGDWFGVGDVAVNGLTIKSVTSDAVVFTLTKDGTTYEHTVRTSQ